MSIELAEQYEEKEEYEKAFQEYKQLLDAKPSSIDLMQRLAHVACILNRQDDVEHYFTKILEKDATNELAYEQLMDLFFDSDKYKYYSNIEIVNVFKTWLEMCYKNYMTKDSLQYEYIKWMNNKSFNKDVLSLKGLWSNDFYNLIIENDFNDVYVYIKNIAKKSNFKSKIKQLLISFANLIG